MRKLLSSPTSMNLSDFEESIYQNVLLFATDLSLNLMAIKVENRPEDFLSWCQELLRLTQQDLRHDLLDEAQKIPLKKMQEQLKKAISISQVKMTRITPWPIFVQFINDQAQLQSLAERLALLDYVQTLTDKPLAELSELDQQVIAGKHSAAHDPSVFNFDAEWFGSTKGNKVFQTLFKQVPSLFDQALSHIPLTGDITKQDYDAFVKEYCSIFSSYTENKANGENAPLLPATRLLAMRRPDVFLVLNNAKLDVLCNALGIPKLNNADFTNYWLDVISPMQLAPWSRAGAPEDEQEKRLWDVRAILMDLFFYAEPEQASNSNYIKLRDKPAKTASRSGASSRVARKKETAEALVDKRLALGDLPEYLLNKRDSLIAEVEAGKDLDKVISLMRSIFG